MQSKSKIAVVIIAFNNDELIINQVRCIRKFCQDDHDIIIVDNSTEPIISESIENFSKQLNYVYFRTNLSSVDFSYSHAQAANLAYKQYCDNYPIFVFLDHDNFPIKKFSPKSILSGKLIAGLKQIKPSGKEYFWPGCLMWNNELLDHSLIDFSPNYEYGLDTGGQFYKLIEEYGENRCLFFDEQHVKNPSFNKSFYDFYSLLNNGMFMHFINSSNWNNSENNNDRIKSLFYILEKHLLSL